MRFIRFMKRHDITNMGVTGSSLLSRKYSLYNKIEAIILNYNNRESAVIYNSGYV